ncbi:hypothetical protein [Planococcus alpniumensis]|nr:hypothetical protein [Planococcus sp. MSAK28401]
MNGNQLFTEIKTSFEQAINYAEGLSTQDQMENVTIKEFNTTYVRDISNL